MSIWQTKGGVNIRSLWSVLIVTAIHIYAHNYRFVNKYVCVVVFILGHAPSCAALTVCPKKEYAILDRVNAPSVQ